MNVETSIRPTRILMAQNGRPTIGFLTPHIAADALVADVWSGMLKAAEDYAVNVIGFLGGELRSHREFQDQANVIYDLARSKNISGLVVWGSALSNFIGADMLPAFCERFAPLPIVDFDEHPKSVTESYDYRGMRLVISHLIDVHGCRRVAFIPGAAGSSATQVRYQAYLDVLRAYNIPVNPDLVASPEYWDESSGRNAVRMLLEHRRVTFEAIAAANDRLAIGAIQALQERNLRVPYDVAVAGFDNNPDGRYIAPPLTTVPYPAEAMGHRAIRIVLARLDGEKIGEQVGIPANLVIRQSCGCINPAVAQAGKALVPTLSGESAIGSAARKDAILKDIEPFLADSAWNDWASQVLDALLIELVKPSATVFLSTLDNVLSSVAAGDGDVASWQNILSLLRCQLLNALADADMRSRAEALLGQGRVLVGEITRCHQGYQALQAEQQNRMLHDISANLISTFDANELMNVLVKELPRLNIPGCYLALYEQPDAPTEWARLFLAYQEQRQIPLTTEGIRFPSRDLLPEEFWPCARRFGLVVEALYFQQQQLGFVLFEVGPQDGKVYEILRKQLSSALQGTLLVQQVQQHARDLAQANAELARKQYILDAFMANVPDAIYFKDRESRIIRANLAHARRVEVDDPAEEIGKTDFDFFTEPEARLRYEQEQTIMQTGQPLIGIEEQQQRIDGRERWSLTTKMPLRDEHGDIIGTFGISRDITKLKEAQASLAQAYEEIQTLHAQLKEESLRYYLNAALLSIPQEASPSGLSDTVRAAWNAPWFCIVMLKLFLPISIGKQAQAAAQEIMAHIRQLYEQYRQEVALAGMFNQITDVEVVLILNVAEADHIQALTAFLQSQSQDLVRKWAAALVLGIGQEVPTLEDLHRSYAIAQQAIFARANTPVTQILTSADITQAHQEALLFAFPAAHESQLIATVVAGDVRKMTECLQALIAQNDLEHARYQKLVALYDRCLRTLSKILAQNPLPAAISEGDDLLHIFRAQKPETLSEFHTQVLDIFRHITGLYHQYQKQRSDILLQRLLRYLEQHYAETTISLAGLADVFKLTPSYISEYFKERTGMKYVDYLAMLRIRKAKELLIACPDMNIADLSQRIGFLNVETFIRTFKRVEGLSPGVYRKHARTS